MSQKQKKKPKGQQSAEKNPPISAPPYYNYDVPPNEQQQPPGMKGVAGPPQPPPSNASPLQNGGNESPQHQQAPKGGYPPESPHGPPPPHSHPQHHPQQPPMHHPHHQQQRPPQMGPGPVGGDKDRASGSPTSQGGVNGPPPSHAHPSMMPGHGGPGGYEMSSHPPGPPHHQQQPGMHGGPPPPPPQQQQQQHMGQQAEGVPKEDPNAYPGHPMQPPYRGYHDPNMMMGHHDPYGHYRGPPSMGGKPAAASHMSGRGPPPPPQQQQQQQQQRYNMGGGPPPSQQAPPNGNPGAGPLPPPQGPPQHQQGPTPTLNSLLQSHPPPNQMPPQQQQQHRNYPPQPSAYDPQQQMPPHPHSQQGPPPPQSPYGPQTGWVPPPRPYSPQMGGQPYRPNNSSRGQSPYSPPSGAPNPGQYPHQQQQPPSGPPVGPTQPQGSAGGPVPPVSGQYSYPQRYPTPPGGPSNHRSPYPPPHQYSDAVRGWAGPGSGHSPAPSPGPQGGHHPPQSPQLHPPQSPGGTGHGPSSSPQPAQSPHPETAAQNSNESSGVNTAATGAGGSVNPQAMRPTPSPTGSSGSRSMSPAVGQPPRPSSNHSQVAPGNNPGGAPNTGAPLNQYPAAGGAPPQQQQSTGGDSPSSRSQTPSGGSQQQPPMHPGQQGSYQPPPPHGGVGGYKMGPNGGPGMQSPYPQAAQSPQQYQQQGNYQPRSPYPGYGQPPGNMPPGGHYPNAGRPMPQPPHGQYPPYHQQPPPQQQQQQQPGQQQHPMAPQGSWTAPPHSPGPGGKSNQQQQQATPVAGQSPGPPQVNNTSGPPPPQQHGGPPGGPPPPPSQGGPNSQRQLNYLKQHLQHKVGSPTPPQQPSGYGNGPGMHPPMGPPHHMGPPPPNGPTNMGPPTTPQSGAFGSGHPGSSHPESMNMEGGPQDNGLSSSGSNSGSGGGAHGNHPVTSLVTTGPDGSLIDEASQQSTLSNASAASADDPQCATPKSRKNDPSFNQSHLASATASPGSGGHAGGHSGEEFEMGSPNWNRTPASPSFNASHAPQENYRSSSSSSTTTTTTTTSTKKSDSLGKLFEMDDNPDRKPWLDRLLGFMDEKRTPITACPTISKQPLDLFRLYLLVKERAGYIEVTKSKTWKDIAGMLGIGASSSAAYTLRKHYSKFILGFECQYDRGGADPAQVMQQAEAGTKKKAAKNTSVPSPVSVAGSSNSQDSFPAPGASNTSMDGYNNYPGGYPPANASGEYTAAPNMPRPPSQSTSPQSNPHPGNAPSSGDNISVSNPFDDPVGPPRVPYQQSTTTPFPPVTRPQGMPYPNQPGYSQYGPEQYPPGQYPPPPPGGSAHQGQFPPPQNRPMYPPYDAENANAAPTANDPYRAYGAAPPAGYQQNRPYPQQGAPAGSPAPGAPPGHQAIPPQVPTGPPGSYPQSPQQDYYRQDQNAQPRRHPDFEKQGQPYPYQQRPGLYGWQNNGQYRGPYPPPSGPQQWPGGQRPPQPGGQPANWDRYGQQNPQAPYPGGQQGQSHWGPMGHSGAPGQSMPGSPNMMRSGAGPPGGPPGPHVQQQRNKQMPMMPGQQQQQQQQSGKPMPGGQFMPQGSVPTKRDIVFPMDSVEATVPVYYRRKRIAKGDIGPVDPWRIFMALRSGLLVESTWALDVINILLFDDTSVQYFGLAHLPGLLNLLLDHFQKSLADMFEAKDKHSTKAILDYGGDEEKEEEQQQQQVEDSELLEPIKTEPGQEKPQSVVLVGNRKRQSGASVDLGCVTEIPDPSQTSVMFRSTTNYTMTSRKGIPVKFNQSSCEEDLFVIDDKRNWDLESDKAALLLATTGADPWTYGHTDLSPHDFLMGCFKAEVVNIPFARYIKGKDKKSKEESADNSAGGDANAAAEESMEVSAEEVAVEAESASSRRSKAGRGPKKAALRSTSPPAPLLVKQEPGVASEEGQKVAARMNGPTVESVESKKAAAKIAEQVVATNGDDETEQEMDIDEESDNRETDKNLFNLTDSVRDPAKVLKRRRMSDYEDECYTRDEASLYLVNDSQDCLARRCVGISNILRNLSFVPGNELEFANSSAFLSVLGKLLLIYHTHPVRAKKTRNYDREEDVDFTDSCSSLAPETEWWWDYLVQIRENMLVAAANISGHMELSRYDEIISRPVLDGLLHWAVCPSAHGQDPFPSCGPHAQLSPQRLALEALCKLCVTDANVDLVIATPPFSRLEKLCAVLTRHLCRNEEQVLREFSVNLLHYLVAADSAMARTVAMQSPCISYLVAFIEQAEQTALGVANQHGINYLRDNPDSMGTSLDMLRRAAGTLLHLSRHPDNRPLFVQQEQRLLALVMSHILDQQVALIISRVLFQVSRGTGPLLSAGVKTLESLMSSSSSSSSSGKPVAKEKSSALTAVLGRSGVVGGGGATEEAKKNNDAKLSNPSVVPASVSDEVVKGQAAQEQCDATVAGQRANDSGSSSSVNNIDKVLNPSKAENALSSSSSSSNRLTGADSGGPPSKTPSEATTNSTSSSAEVYNTSCGKQQLPPGSAAASGVPGSPPPSTSSTGGSQMLTSPIVSISS